MIIQTKLESSIWANAKNHYLSCCFFLNQIIAGILWREGCISLTKDSYLKTITDRGKQCWRLLLSTYNQIRVTEKICFSPNKRAIYIQVWLAKQACVNGRILGRIMLFAMEMIVEKRTSVKTLLVIEMLL